MKLICGRTYTREQWAQVCPPSQKVEGEGYTAMVSCNYQCFGPYGPSQKVKFLSYDVTAWLTEPGWQRSASVTALTKASISKAIRNAILLAAQQCAHKTTREIGAEEAAKHGVTHYGNCYHVYLCADCGAAFGVDSSG